MAIKEITKEERKIRRKRIRLLLKVIGATIVLLLIYWGGCVFLDKMLFKNPIYNLKEIEISGNIKLTTQELLLETIYKRYQAKTENSEQRKEPLGNLDAFRGENLFSLPLRDIRESLEALPLVYNAEVRRIFPNKLQINLSERRLIAVLANGRTIDDARCIGPRLLAKDVNYLPKFYCPSNLLVTLEVGEKLPKELCELCDLINYLNTTTEIENFKYIDPICLSYEDKRLDPNVKLILRAKGPFEPNATLLLPLNNPKYDFKEALQKVDAIIEDRKRSNLKIKYLDATVSNYLNVR